MYDMMNAKFEHDWQQTSTLLAMIYNSNPFRKGKGKSPDNFMPGKSGKMKERKRLTSANLMEAFD